MIDLVIDLRYGLPGWPPPRASRGCKACFTEPGKRGRDAFTSRLIPVSRADESCQCSPRMIATPLQSDQRGAAGIFSALRRGGTL